nr:hypothetical protein [Tanacetum cinerariifolium]
MANMSISFINSSGPSSYAKLVTGEPSRKSVNFCILLAPAGNGPDVAISSSYARAMIELRANVELKDTIMVVVLKLTSEGFSMCTIRIEYEWKPPRCSTCKVFGHNLDDCPKRIVSYVLKNLKNPRQIVRGVQVGPKLGFRLSKFTSMSLKRIVLTQVRETYDEYVYDDDFDDYGLTAVALKFANAFDINLRGQLRSR